MRVKSFSAYTNEVDDVEAAVSELMARLDLDGANKLKKSSVGIASCFAEYTKSGVWKALCEKLPFDVVGTTTIMNATLGKLGETMFCLTVLTSDELCFTTGLSDPITSEEDAPLREMYRQAAMGANGNPALLLSYSPLFSAFSSDYYVDKMTQISGGVPNFGTLACDHNADYGESRALYNGEAYNDRIAIALISGCAEPSFYAGAISGERVFADKSVVTGSEDNRLMTVDGMPVVNYLESLGLSKNEDGSVTGVNAFPILVDYGDGSPPVARAIFAITPEGYAVCGGNIPVGASISVGSFDEKDIVDTCKRTLAEALASGRHNTLLIFSCIGRYFAQSYNPTAEFRAVVDAIENANKSGGGADLGGDAISGGGAKSNAGAVSGDCAKSGAGLTWMAAYSGGELCPVYNRDGGYVNRNHNNSFVVCGL